MSDDLLNNMVASARERVAQARRERPRSGPPSRLPCAGRLRDALRTPRTGGLGLIAEVKRCSPSKGPIDTGLVAAEHARAYEEAGADAISVLTEPARFGGSLDDLAEVAAAVSLPVLRKDFIVDPYQVWEAAELGAAAVLLIAAALPGDRLAALLRQAERCGLDALVEVHDEAEVARALAAGSSLVGANNRDLRTLAVDPGITARVAARLGDRLRDNVLLVSESGIAGASDARRAARAGARALLVGEALVRAPRDRLRTLVAELKAVAP